MSDLPLHRTMQDDEIDRLKAQLREAEEKGRVLVGMCRDLKARAAEYEKQIAYWRSKAIDLGALRSPHSEIEKAGGEK